MNDTTVNPQKPVFVIAHTDVQYRIYCRDNNLIPNRTAYRLTREHQIQGFELTRDQVVELEGGSLSFPTYSHYMRLMEFVETRFRIKQ